MSGRFHDMSIDTLQNNSGREISMLCDRLHGMSQASFLCLTVGRFFADCNFSAFHFSWVLVCSYEVNAIFDP